VRQGTAYFGVRAEEPNYTIAMRALAEGNSLRGTGRIVDVDKDTICDWVDRAGRHGRAVTTYLFDTLHITECQVDELWSFVRKKEAHLSVAEKVLALYGDAWVWIAFAPSMAPGGRLCGGQTRSRARQHAARACASCQLRVYTILYQ
jgi:type II secretory pathway component PulL